jgi:hypothetical protein
VSDDIGYILSVFLFLGGLVVLAGVSLLVVEGAYWLYCKIKGRDY